MRSIVSMTARPRSVQPAPVFFSPGRRALWARVASQFAFGVLPVLSLVLLSVLFVGQHLFALDFHHWYWPAGQRLLHGQSPYARPYPWGLNYPASAALLFVPFALVPRGIADVVFTVLVVLAVPGTLRLLDVRDWRIYGISMLFAPVVFGWQTANMSLLLVLGVAAAWRLRNRAMAAGLLVALVVSLKLFLWPLALWLLVTRRYLALGWAAIFGVVISVGAFAIVGLGELSRYVSQLHGFLADAERRSYSVLTLAIHLGAGRAFAYVLLLAAGSVAVGACVALGRRGYERQAMAAAIAASLLASPIVEAHYLALLLVPLALTYRRLNPVWLLPLALWLTPADWPADWQRVVFIGLSMAILAIASTHSVSPALVGQPHPLRRPRRAVGNQPTA